MIKNIFSDIQDSIKEEVFETILGQPGFKVERIVSGGQSTPEDQWYDQGTDEWVILLAGSAGLYFEGESDVRTLKPGDYVLIPAHTRHRVEWTDKEQKTVWLAIHFGAG